MKRMFLFSALALCILWGGWKAWAQDVDIFVVISGRKVSNVVVVAKNGGQYKSVQEAMDSITDACADNPYLVVIGPGIYTISQTLVMKEYVDIVGGGENVTKLQGAISTGIPNESSAIISGADNSTLSSLTVENTGGSAYSIALYNKDVSPTVSNVTATASGGAYSYGMHNSSSSPTMTGVTVVASGSSSSYGVYNKFSCPTMTNVTVTAAGGTYTYGVYNNYSSPTMTNVTATASGGTNSYGVRNSTYCTPHDDRCDRHGLRGDKQLRSIQSFFFFRRDKTKYIGRGH